MQTLQNNCR